VAEVPRRERMSVGPQAAMRLTRRVFGPWCKARGLRRLLSLELLIVPRQPVSNLSEAHVFAGRKQNLTN